MIFCGSKLQTILSKKLLVCVCGIMVFIWSGGNAATEFISSVD